MVLHQLLPALLLCSLRTPSDNRRPNAGIVSRRPADLNNRSDWLSDLRRGVTQHQKGSLSFTFLPRTGWPLVGGTGQQELNILHNALPWPFGLHKYGVMERIGQVSAETVEWCQP